MVKAAILALNRLCKDVFLVNVSLPNLLPKSYTKLSITRLSRMTVFCHQQAKPMNIKEFSLIALTKSPRNDHP